MQSPILSSVLSFQLYIIRFYRNVWRPFLAVRFTRNQQALFDPFSITYEFLVSFVCSIPLNQVVSVHFGVAEATMAQQQRLQEPVKWKLGSKCDLFVRDIMEWAEGEIIGSYSDDKGEWVKVRCGQKVYDILSRDPDIRERAQNKSAVIVDIDKLKELEEAFLIKNIASGATIFQQLLAPTVTDTDDKADDSDTDKGILHYFQIYTV